MVDKNNDTIKYYSFEEWNNMGFNILKGEHSHKRAEDGTPLFSEEQVEISFRDMIWDTEIF